MKILVRLLLVILFFVRPSFADRINVFEFTDAELLDLQVRKVRGADNKTEYSVGYNDNGNYEWIEDPVKASQRITVNAGATFRASRRFSFIAEAWLFNPRDPTLLGGPGIRYFRKINRVTAKNGAGAKTFDFQLLMSPEWDGIIPMIGASQKF